MQKVALKEAEIVNKWFTKNGLLLNCKKSKGIVFGSNRSIIVKIDNKEIMFVNELKILGIWFDKLLNFNNQINFLCKTLHKYYFVFNYMKQLIPLQTLILLYKSLVYSRISYCCVIWGYTYDCHIRELQMCQNKILRIIFSYKQTDTVSPIFKKQSF